MASIVASALKGSTSFSFISLNMGWLPALAFQRQVVGTWMGMGWWGVGVVVVVSGVGARCEWLGGVRKTVKWWWGGHAQGQTFGALNNHYALVKRERKASGLSEAVWLGCKKKKDKLILWYLCNFLNMHIEDTHTVKKKMLSQLKIIVTWLP